MFSVELIYEKATKNKYVFVQNEEEGGVIPFIPSLYIDKRAFEGKRPDTIIVTVKAD